MHPETGITKEMVEHWKRIGPKLAEIRRRELREFNYEEQLPLIDALLQMGCDMAVPRTSGLVELQRRLARLKR
jgi:hypothetical protein